LLQKSCFNFRFDHCLFRATPGTSACTEYKRHILYFFIAALQQQYFGEDYVDDDWAWEPVHLLGFLQDPVIANLEADPEP
jgi:hypothetical protein